MPIQDAMLLASDGGRRFRVFGLALGFFVVVAAMQKTGTSIALGSVYVFHKYLRTRTQAAKLVAPDAAEKDYFGWSIAIPGDIVVADAYLDQYGGYASCSAYVFENNDATWTHTDKLIRPAAQRATGSGAQSQSRVILWSSVHGRGLVH